LIVELLQFVSYIFPDALENVINSAARFDVKQRFSFGYW